MSALRKTRIAGRARTSRKRNLSFVESGTGEKEANERGKGGSEDGEHDGELFNHGT